MASHGLGRENREPVAQQAHHAQPHSGGHGHTAAAWTAVTVMLVGSLVSSLAVILLNWPLFWVGLAVIAVGAVTGKVMAMMGMGAPPPPPRSAAARRP